MVATLSHGIVGFWPRLWVQQAAQPVGRNGGLARVLPTDDTGLAQLAARGDRAAFTKLVELHQRSVYGLSIRLLRDPEEAADAAQEAFVRAFAALKSFDPAQPFVPWLLRIARNHCLDILRRRLPADRVLALDATPEGEDGQGRSRELPDERAVRSDDALETAQRNKVLGEAVEKLPFKYREVVTLFHVQQLSYQQIATVMGVPLGTVMTWLHRARAQLRVALQNREEVAP
jgi:RNA polymerase sigma-70 factor (ECF subfamily)